MFHNFVTITTFQVRKYSKCSKSEKKTQSQKKQSEPGRNKAQNDYFNELYQNHQILLILIDIQLFIILMNYIQNHQILLIIIITLIRIEIRIIFKDIIILIKTIITLLETNNKK